MRPRALMTSVYFELNNGIPRCVQVVGLVCRFYMSLHIHPTYFLNKYVFLQGKVGEVD